MEIKEESFKKRSIVFIWLVIDMVRLQREYDGRCAKAFYWLALSFGIKYALISVWLLSEI